MPLGAPPPSGLYADPVILAVADHLSGSGMESLPASQ